MCDMMRMKESSEKSASSLRLPHHWRDEECFMSLQSSLSRSFILHVYVQNETEAKLQMFYDLKFKVHRFSSSQVEIIMQF